MAYGQKATLSDIERAAIQVFLARNLEAYCEDQMSVRDLQEAYPQIPGIQTLTIADGEKGSKIYTIGNKSIVIEYNTTMANIAAQLAKMMGITLLPTNKLQPSARMSITGRVDLKTHVNAAKARVAAARQEAANAVKDVNDAVDLVDSTVKQLKQDAVDIRAEVSDLSNGGPV